MNILNITFDDLCAFFTKYSSHLMVGMISTDKAPPEDVHEPHIIIRQNGILKREYRGFEEVNGDVRLDVYPAGKGLTHYRPRSSSDPRQSLARLIDIQRDLY